MNTWHCKSRISQRTFLHQRNNSERYFRRLKKTSHSSCVCGWIDSSVPQPWKEKNEFRCVFRNDFIPRKKTKPLRYKRLLSVKRYEKKKSIIKERDRTIDEQEFRQKIRSKIDFQCWLGSNRQEDSSTSHKSSICTHQFPSGQWVH